jgi:hypothetical protein
MMMVWRVVGLCGVWCVACDFTDALVLEINKMERVTGDSNT